MVFTSTIFDINLRLIVTNILNNNFNFTLSSLLRGQGPRVNLIQSCRMFLHTAEHETPSHQLEASREINRKEQRNRQSLGNRAFRKSRRLRQLEHESIYVC